MYLPPKPREGAPCNGCGMCCALEVCEIGRRALPGATAPCPIMAHDGKRIVCRLVVLEADAGLVPLIAMALGIGKGCCASDT